jgi:hypothetical protein
MEQSTQESDGSLEQDGVGSRDGEQRPQQQATLIRSPINHRRR